MPAWFRLENYYYLRDTSDLDFVLALERRLDMLKFLRHDSLPRDAKDSRDFHHIVLHNFFAQEFDSSNKKLLISYSSGFGTSYNLQTTIREEECLHEQFYQLLRQLDNLEVTEFKKENYFKNEAVSKLYLHSFANSFEFFIDVLSKKGFDPSALLKDLFTNSHGTSAFSLAATAVPIEKILSFPSSGKRERSTIVFSADLATHNDDEILSSLKQRLEEERINRNIEETTKITARNDELSKLRDINIIALLDVYLWELVNEKRVELKVLLDSLYFDRTDIDEKKWYRKIRRYRDRVMSSDFKIMTLLQ
ncbi:DUF6387 family protein [Alteromonas oceanisediminis]|uniref:DUF6387 family protein n=1 Tax=Alteromonas oceanisediminis TaxID=2836180 RepID=UPI001BDAD164|nr:DUF6387 family protein [Alteromonas oceanisediminis]MBT0585111.1 hypothetical protein [Alteromonas oceanisediminis]